MKSTNPISVPLSTCDPPGGRPVAEAAETTHFLRFPHGVCPVVNRAAGEHERAFYARYINDIQFLIDNNRSAWSDRRICLAGENNPVIEFDPEWFPFLLPPKEETKTELFAWYWLWVEGDRMLSASRFAFEELEASFSEASGYAEVFTELYSVVDTFNRALDGGPVADRALGRLLVEGVGASECRDRLRRERLRFLDLLVDYEPTVFGCHGAGGESAFAVRVYRVAGEPLLGNVSGQVRAVYRRGCWKIDPLQFVGKNRIQKVHFHGTEPLSAGS